MTAADLLRGARDRLNDPARWLHGSPGHAVDATGRVCSPRAPEATRWDLYGALCVTGDGCQDHVIEDALRRLALALGVPGELRFEAVMKWHDKPERTHAEVLALLGKTVG